ncbi:MAG: 23S rRNA (guanosine(2251)-2'-O)-methyltransferase RlmB, partial [Firmicutes bacterium]|nr:23S rRNA (guanosine(2251)-2'-O)-methyltransferase RlmB [Bacillota bacterium]
SIALVIGNEGRGVSERLMELSDIRVKIPMAGSIESLNAAVAAGILMYQSQKKNNER